MGRKDNEGAEKILGACFTLQLMISVVLTAVLLIWNRDFLLAFGASENTIEYATSYMSIYALGTVFVQLTLGMNAFIAAQGFTKVSMISVLIGAGANIILDPILIYALNMGVQGAALATILSQACSCIWGVSFLFGKKTLLRIKAKHLTLSPRVLLPCLALGTATFIMQSSESVIAVCFNSSLLEYGGDIAVGAMTILSSVMQFAMLPAQGIAQGAQPILSYNYGAGDANRVKKAFRILLVTCLGYSVLLWSCIMLFPKSFCIMFTPDVALIDFAAPMLRIYFGGMLMFGIQIACQMTFVSLGKAGSSVIVAVVRKFVLILPLIYIMPHVISDPTRGVFTAEPIADITAVTFTAILFAFQFKKAIEQLNQD